MNDPKEIQTPAENIVISQSVAILIDGNNIERSIHSEAKDTNTMLNFDALIPKLLVNRGLSRLVYFREGTHISNKLQWVVRSDPVTKVRISPCRSMPFRSLIKLTQLLSCPVMPITSNW